MMKRLVAAVATACAFSYPLATRAATTLQPMQFTFFCLKYPADSAPRGRSAEALSSEQLLTVNAAIVPRDDPNKPWQVNYDQSC